MIFRRAWCSISLRELILVITILACLFAWLRERQALQQAELLFGPLVEAYNDAKSLKGDTAFSHEVDGVEIEWSVHLASE